jgi:post-segregation antitoxin (ccd killing protein)
MKKKKPTKWIQAIHMKKGSLTKQAKDAGMSVSEFADQTLKKGSKASTTTKRRAILSKTRAKVRRKKR